jgi:hypothetical protein
MYNIRSLALARVAPLFFGVLLNTCIEIDVSIVYYQNQIICDIVEIKYQNFVE